ncbi:MAG: phosphatidylglycerol--membrane-oligosaccharide glycerophosphotransferase, partial [Candidatus Electrothrix sp. AR3]|nr:phosphatidylglycerol--membrane-oligosaccharide glycerophosphotransferase [Candidatus Electrothrix sp. AR3]
MSKLHLIFSLLSLLFFCTGMIRCFGAGKFSRSCFTALVAYGIFYLFYSVFYFICYYFTGKGIDYSVLYHVKYGLEGAGFNEYRGLIFFSILFILFFSSLGFFLLLKAAKHRKQPSGYTFLFLGFLFFLSGASHPANIDLYSLFMEEEGVPFMKYYRTPYLDPLRKQPRNFVLIYAESLERTYWDEKIFPGLITSLKAKEAEGISFTNLGEYPETGWTIAGMVASQCGLPLVSPSHGNSMGGMDSFLTGAVCMGEMLKQDGYHLAFMGGASLKFAGKGKFYTTHGFTEVLGRRELKPLLADASYNSGWGLHDDSLFDLAAQKFEDLSKKKQPFGLVVLTLDTHGNDHLSRSCQNISYGDGTNSTLNAVACSSYLIDRFIERLRQSPQYKDTVIAVASDHLAMRNGASGLLEQSGKRRNLF